MPILKQYNPSISIDEQSLFQKKIVPISFKEFYLSQSLHTSPYQLSKRKIHVSYFMRLQNNIRQLFSPSDKYIVEKKEINDLVANLIAHSNYSDLNQFMKNGLSLNPFLISSLLEKTKRNEVEVYLEPLQKKDNLYGILAEVFFISSHVQIFCHQSLSILAKNFPQEYISPEIFNNFSNDSATYKGIKLRDLNYDKNHGIQAIHMHNNCLNPHFSMRLFFHALQRAFLYEQFEYTSIKWSIGSVLQVLLPYIKPYFSPEDKQFLSDLVQTQKDQMFKKGVTEEIKVVINDLHELIKIQFHSTDSLSYKDVMLNKTKEIYGNTDIISHNFLPLKIETVQFLDIHTTLIDSIINIHKKLSGNEVILDNDNIDKINKIIADTLPTTIEKYSQIDEHFRDTIKNIEGKNAHQLFEESLQNILYSMQEVEINLEQAKVNELSLVNRKNRIK